MSYCEWPEMYDERYVRAIKKHHCVECAASIVPGERYLAYRGKWNGKFSHGHQHLLCRAACMWVRDKFQDGECLGFGELKEYWDEFAKWKKERPQVRVFRKMMARILWRERGRG